MNNEQKFMELANARLLKIMELEAEIKQLQSQIAGWEIEAELIKNDPLMYMRLNSK